MCHTSLCEKAEQSHISVKGCTNTVERRIRRRGLTSITTETTLHSNIPTVTYNSRHYSVQTAGRCHTPRSISSLLIERPIQSVATNTDFSSRLFMSCFAADIPLLVQPNWYCQLCLAHQTADILQCLVSQNTKCCFLCNYSDQKTHKADPDTIYCKKQ